LNRCVTVLQTAPLPLGYAAFGNLEYVLEKTNLVKPQTDIENQPRRWGLGTGTAGPGYRRRTLTTFGFALTRRTGVKCFEFASDHL
jgi:hypothetical protein